MRYTVGYQYTDGRRSNFAWFNLLQDAEVFLKAISGLAPRGHITIEQVLP